MENRFKVLDLLELALVSLGFLREPGPFRVEQRLQLLELFRRFQMPDDLLQDPDLVLRRQGRSNGRAEPNDQLLPLGDLVPGSPDQVNEFQPGAGPIAALAASLHARHEPPRIQLHALEGVRQVMLEPFKRNHAYAVALPIALALFGDLLVESLELVKIADEVLGRRQLVQAWKRAGEKRPVFVGQLRIDSVESLYC